MPQTLTLRKQDVTTIPQDYRYNILNNTEVRSILTSYRDGFFKPVKAARIRHLSFSLPVSKTNKIEHKVTLTDEILIHRKKDTEDIQIDVIQELTYEGCRLPLLVFIALILINSKTYKDILDDCIDKEFIEEIDLSKAVATIMAKLGAIAFVFRTFILDHISELGFNDSECRLIIEQKQSEGWRLKLSSIVLGMLYPKISRDFKRDLETVLAKMKTLDLSDLQSEQGLPHSIVHPGIFTQDEVKVGFTGW